MTTNNNFYKKSNLFGKIYIVLFLIVMFSGSTPISRFVMPIICLMVILLVLTSIIKGFPKNSVLVKENYLLTGIVLLIILFLMYQLTYSYDASITVVFVERFIAFLFLIIFVPKVEENYKIIKCLRWCSYIVAISILFMSVISGGRSGGIVGSYQYAGMLMSISFGIFLIDYYFEKKKSNVIGLVVTFLALLTSGKRTFTMLALLAYLLVYIFTNDKEKKKKFFKLSFALIIIIIIAYMTIPSVRLVAQRLISFSDDNTYNGRSYYWSAAFDIFEDNRLFGIGMGCFSEYFDKYFHRLGNLEAYDAHNIYIQMLAELGIIGETLFIFLFIIALIKTVRLFKNREIKNSKECMYVLCYSIYLQIWFIVYGMTGNPIYGASQTFFYITAISMMLSLKMHYRYLLNNDKNNDK